jgi:hypothetical protein
MQLASSNSIQEHASKKLSSVFFRECSISCNFNSQQGRIQRKALCILGLFLKPIFEVRVSDCHVFSHALIINTNAETFLKLGMGTMSSEALLSLYA